MSKETKELSEKEQIAQKILGKNFISHHEVSRILGEKFKNENSENLVYSNNEIKELINKIPDESFLRKLEGKNILVSPTPPRCFRLLEDITRLYRGFLCMPTDMRMDFLRKVNKVNEEKIKDNGWFFLEKNITGVNMNYHEQIKLIQSNGFLKKLPTVTELSWLSIIYYLTRGDMIFDKKYHVRTASLIEDNHSIFGFLKENKVNISYFPDNLKSMIVGVIPLCSYNKIY
ncbi:MAG: hypothetical protein PHO28_01000 [Candidatus Pacebacteria bacterium]|nr:hypothetical protein [Candidatus Paceibacterota bacterium]